MSLYVASSIAMGYLEYKFGSTKLLFVYGSIVWFFQSLFLFAALLRLKPEKIISHSWGKMVAVTLSLVGRYSIGIYGWHQVLTFTLRHFLQGLGLPGYIHLPLYVLSTIFLALIVAMTDTWFWAKVRSLLTPFSIFARQNAEAVLQKFSPQKP